MEIVEQIFASPEGGTASLNGEKLPAYGCFVGGLVSPLILGNGPEFTPDAKWDAEVFVAHLRLNTDAGYVGWWTDEETGKLWVDGADWYSSVAKARVIGRQRHEIAIYDIANERELRLK